MTEALVREAQGADGAALSKATREERIRRAERRERRADLARELSAFVSDAGLLDYLATLDVDPAALWAVLIDGVVLMAEHRADADTRQHDRAGAMRYQRRGEMELRFVKSRGRWYLVELVDDAAHWRFAPRPVGRGNPEKRILAEVRRRLVLLGVRDRAMRERLLKIL